MRKAEGEGVIVELDACLFGQHLLACHISRVSSSASLPQASALQRLFSGAALAAAERMACTHISARRTTSLVNSA